MKKLLWIATGLVITVFVALLSVPLFVDVDQYRPVIVGEVNKRINGQLELGKLKLGLWGSLKIHAESIRLSVNGFSGSMVDAQQFRLEIPYMSILGGAPQVTAVLENPRISILKDSRGKTNAMELMNMPGASAESSEMKGSESVAGDSLSFSSSAPQKKPDSSARNGKAPLPPAAPEFAKRKATAEAPQAGNGSATSAPAESGSAPVSAAPLASPAKAAPVQVPKLLAGARLEIGRAHV